MMIGAAMVMLAGVIAAAPAGQTGANRGATDHGAAGMAATGKSVAGWPCATPPPAPSTLAAIWPGQRDGSGWLSDPAVAALVAEVSPRNVAPDAAIARIRAFAAGNPDRTSAMARVAAGLIDTIGSEEQLIVTGIRRFNARQAVLARRIEQGYARADAQTGAQADGQADTKPGGAAASQAPGAAEEQMEWDTRIFEDRQRLLPVMCKLPAILADRLTALAGAARESAR